MTPEAADALERFFGAFAGARNPLLLLDYDGTLSPFRVDRFKARPYAGISGLLGRIQAQGQTRIVFITGRPAAEIAPLLGLKTPLEVWGLHGAERLYPDGRRELEQQPAQALIRLEELRQHLRADSLGGLLEEKDNAVVMHWRGHSHAVAKAIERRTRALFEPAARIDGLSLLDFGAGLELRVGRDKGGAVEAILAEQPECGPVAFLGDDLSDESAFAAVNRAVCAHLSVLMRRERRETVAEVWLQPPEELKAFLNRWTKAGNGA